MSKCSRCGAPASDGYTYCELHRKGNSARKKRYQERQKAKGLCIMCKEKAIDGNQLCAHHAEIAKEANTRRRHERIAAGRCNKCAQGIALPGKLSCEACWFKITSYRACGSACMAEALRVLFYSNPVCPYSGRALIAGVNSSLDHIVPQAKGGTHELSNLQFVYHGEDFQVNWMKGNQNDTEYKGSIAIQYKHIFKDNQ